MPGLSALDLPVRLVAFVARQASHDLYDALPKSGVLELSVGSQKLYRARLLQQFCRGRQPRSPGRVRSLLSKEISDRNFQDRAELLQATRAHPVAAVLVFLHLLKGDAELSWPPPADLVPAPAAGLAAGLRPKRLFP